MPIIKNEKFDHDSDLAYERRRGKKCDVKLMLAKRSYNLHSSVLNKESPHFKRELSTKQPNNDGIRVLNVTRHGVGAIDLEKILDYMYGQKLSVSEVGPAIRLMAVTKCFKMSHLEEQILRYLSCLVLDDLVHVSVCCGMLFESSTRLRLSKVRRNMARFLAQQLHLKRTLKAINTLEYANFRQVLERVRTDEKIKCKSLHRFLAIASWVDSDVTANNETVPQILNNPSPQQYANRKQRRKAKRNRTETANNETEPETANNPSSEQDGNMRKRQKKKRSRAEMADVLLKDYVTLDDAKFGIRGMGDLDEMVAYKLTKDNPQFAKKLQEKIKELTDKALGKSKQNAPADNEQQDAASENVTNTEIEMTGETSENAANGVVPAGDAGNSMIDDQQGVVQTANTLNPTNDAQQEVEPVDHSVNPPADAEQEVVPVGVTPNPTENVN